MALIGIESNGVDWTGSKWSGMVAECIGVD